MNARDMQRRGLADGDVVRLETRRGELDRARRSRSTHMRAGQVFLPMHWGSQFMRGAGVNALTVPEFDPLSSSRNSSTRRSKSRPSTCRYRVVAMRRFDAGAAEAVQALREALQPLLQAFDYATLTLNGRDNAVVILRGYAATPISDSVLDTLDRLFDLADAGRTMRYVDARRRVEKAALVEAGMVQSVCLSGETAAQEWLKNMMIEGAPAEAMRAWILAPVAAPPRGSFNRGRIVCNCLDVAETEIRAALAGALACRNCRSN